MQNGSASPERHSETKSQSFRHDFQHQGSQHPAVWISFCVCQSGADLFSKLLIDSPHFNQAFEISFDKGGRPLPHVIDWSEAKDVWPCGANHKTLLTKQSR